MLRSWFRPHPDHSPALITLMLIRIGIGAVIAIGTAAALMARKDRPLLDDPDAPLFI